MKASSFKWFTTVCVAFMLSACSSYELVRAPTQPVPSTLSLAPTEFGQAKMYGKSYEEWKAGLSAKQLASAQGDDAVFEDVFRATLADRAQGRWTFAPGSAMTVRVVVTEVSRFVARGYVKGKVQLLDPSQAVVAEIYLEKDIGGSYTAGMTMKGCADQFARATVDFLEAQQHR